MTTLRQDKKLRWQQHRGPSHLGWALLLLVTTVAAVLRFWQLGQIPPGLYRDEAYNGLDALNVLAGEHRLFFTANNGREPSYIYLTALFIAMFGRSALAVRLAAAVAGTFTTWVTFQLARAWFGQRVGMLSAILWAITLWPVHLSRIGLRPILMVPALALTCWLGTMAYRRQERRLWLAAGVIYGISFYTYLAVRFTPVLLLLLGAYLLWNRRRAAWLAGIPWFVLGLLLAIAPLVLWAVQQPDFLSGRTGQVSILNPNIHQGDLWGTLWHHIGQGLGLFLGKGDTILRHNPPGRPLFDLFMALPFLAGLAWCVRNWRRPAAFLLLLWVGVMLGPTILAEDTPHFLRATGMLPAVLMLPALGLTQLWEWDRLPSAGRQALVIVLVLASLWLTISDYSDYGRQEDVAYLFEAAAAELAYQVRAESEETKIFVDERFWSGWPSIPFLAGSRPVSTFQPEMGFPGPGELPLAIYAWPYGPLDFVPQVVESPALVAVEVGSLARGDLDPVAAPLYVRYGFQPALEMAAVEANFGNQLQLRQAAATFLEGNLLTVDLIWSSEKNISQPLVVFVHVIQPDGQFLAQDDAPVARGRWPEQWWRPGMQVVDRHLVRLPGAYLADEHSILIGVYDAVTRVRLPVLDPGGAVMGDSWLLSDVVLNQP